MVKYPYRSFYDLYYTFILNYFAILEYITEGDKINNMHMSSNFIFLSTKSSPRSTFKWDLWELISYASNFIALIKSERTEDAKNNKFNK